MIKHVLGILILICGCLGIGVVFMGCGSKTVPPPSPDFAPSSGGSVEVNILEPYPDGTDGMIYTVGLGSSRNLNIAKSMAEQRARAQLALETQAHVKALFEDFQGQYGADVDAQINAAFSQVSERLAQETLSGTRTVKTKAMKEPNGLYNVQTMLGIPIKDNIEDPIIEEIGDAEASRHKFEAWQARERMDKKILKLEQEKSPGASSSSSSTP